MIDVKAMRMRAEMVAHLTRSGRVAEVSRDVDSLCSALEMERALRNAAEAEIQRLRSERPAVTPEMVERFRRALKPCDVACDAHLVQALEAALRVRGEPSREPTLEEIVTATWFALQVRYGFSGYIDDSLFAWVRARLSPPTPEVSRMEPFPLVPIPPHEVERETKAFHEKFAKHEDKDGMEPYDWREHQTMQWAIIQGFIGPFTPEGWYTFKRHRALTVTDPERPGWEAFRMWALEILNGPSTPEPDPWPVYDAEAYQAERLRRASE